MDNFFISTAKIKLTIIFHI